MKILIVDLSPKHCQQSNSIIDCYMLQRGPAVCNLFKTILKPGMINVVSFKRNFVRCPECIESGNQLKIGVD